MKRVGTRWAWLAVAGGAMVGLLGVFPRPVEVRWSVPLLAEDPYVPMARQDSGDELVFVFIGSSRCRWSNDAQLPSLVKQARTAVTALAQEASIGFAAIGLTTDVVPESGVEHLGRFGGFDQIVTGMGWRNIGLMKYLHGELYGPAATPQVLVLARSVVVEAGHRAVRNERLLVRRHGLSGIREWVEGGSRIPQFGDVAP